MILADIVNEPTMSHVIATRASTANESDIAAATLALQDGTLETRIV